MKKSMLRKDFYEEIKTSWGRFVSIFLIVALGVSFYSGIRASEPSMRISGDAYFDEEKLMDLRVMSTMGLTGEDVSAIEAVDGIELAEGSYSVDALCPVSDTEHVVHILSMQDAFQNYTVTEGRLPEKAGECLMDEDFEGSRGYEIGDTVTFTSGTDESLTEKLTTETFTIVGFGNSPMYISFMRGNSTVGNGEVSGFVAVTEDSFHMDTYTEIYVRVSGLKETTAFTDAYEELSDQAADALGEIEKERCDARRASIVAEAEEELEDAQATVDEETQTLLDAKEELASSKSSAAKELQEARQKLLDAEKTLEESRQQIADGERQLTEGKNELIRLENTVASGLQQYEEGIAQIRAEETKLTESETEISQKKQELSEEKQQLAAWKEKIAQGKEELAQILEPMRLLAGSLDQIREALAEMETQLEEGEALFEEYGMIPAEERTEEQTAFLTEWPEKREALCQGIEQQTGALRLIETKLQEQFESEEVFRQQLAAAEENEKQLLEQEGALVEAEALIQEGETQLAAYEQQIADGKQKIEQGRKTLEQTKQQLDAAGIQIQNGWAQLNSQEQNLISGKKQLTDGEQELQDGWSEYEQGAAEAARKIADGEAQIREGEEKLADARAEIAEARAEIEKIEYPEWYIQDRDDALPEYSGYGQNADRMRAIGRVFPAVFFLVAALISLTAMTRMVEEQRIQIGTLKALGYSKISIAGKYIAYALTATFGGSVVGVLIGEKIFPFIIIYAYKIVYQHIPHILVPYHMEYAVQATLIAVLCTLAATVMACYRELAAVPAELMRPPSPRQGKRILLERIGFVWRRMNFTWKSSVRNLVRYKKRFFMTVFGIGGCMGLMLVGFGLKDCIFEIPDLQYGEIQFYDASVYYDSEISREEKKEIQDAVKQENLVESQIGVRMQNVEVSAGGHTESVYLTIPEDGAKMEEFVEFRSRTKPETYNLEKDQVILTEKAAQVLDVEVGDTVSFNDDDLGQREVVIGAISENYMGHYLYLSPEYYESLYDTEPNYNCVLFRMEEGEKAQAESVGSRILENDKVLNVTYTKSIESQLGDMLESLNIVVVVLIISAGLLAFVVLYNLNTINIAERRRELATIKVLGFFDVEVASFVYRENIILTIIGMLAGMGLGRVLLQFIVVTVEVDEVMFGRVIHLPSYLYSMLFTIAFSMIVNLVMYFKLKNIDMVESLKSME